MYAKARGWVSSEDVFVSIGSARLSLARRCNEMTRRVRFAWFVSRSFDRLSSARLFLFSRTCLTSYLIWKKYLKKKFGFRNQSLQETWKKVAIVILPKMSKRSRAAHPWLQLRSCSATTWASTKGKSESKLTRGVAAFLIMFIFQGTSSEEMEQLSVHFVHGRTTLSQK